MFPLIQLPRKSEAVSAFMRLMMVLVSINSTSEEVRSSGSSPSWLPLRTVSINSTSEEVRSLLPISTPFGEIGKFPLIQLPRKSEVLTFRGVSLMLLLLFPLIQLPRKSEEIEEFSGCWSQRIVSINSTSEEVRSNLGLLDRPDRIQQFPLIQLPRKSEANITLLWSGPFLVSINSTSEEVRSPKKRGRLDNFL